MIDEIKYCKLKSKEGPTFIVVRQYDRVVNEDGLKRAYVEVVYWAEMRGEAVNAGIPLAAVDFV